MKNVQSLDDKQKIKLLVLSSTYPRWAGDTTPSFVHQLASSLPSSYEVHALAPHQKGLKLHEVIDGVFVHRFRYAPASFETLAYGTGIPANIRQQPAKALLLPLFCLSQILSLILLQKKHRFDIFHAHWFVPQGLSTTICRIFSSDFKVIITSHGSDLELSKYRLVKLMYRWIAKKAQALTFVSSAMREKSAALGILSNRNETIPMGINLDTFYPNETNEIQNTKIACVARLIKAKGVDTIISAIYELKLRNIHATLLIIGSGPENQKLQQQAKQLGIANQVSFLGQKSQNEIATLLRDSAIFVSASHAEGFGLSIAEAMACGCAVIVTDIPAMKDLVDDKKGRKFPAGNPEILANRIEELLSDPIARKNLATEAMTYSTARFNWKFIAESYSNLYERLEKK